MADGGLKIELDKALSARLTAAAGAAGTQPEAMAAALIREALDSDWAEDYARAAEYAATGELISAEQCVAELREAVAARFSRK